MGWTVSNIMSLDGYFEGPGGNVMALNMDGSFDAYNLERIQAADVMLLGRASYEGFSGYWPGVASAPPDPGNRALSETNRELSRIYNRLEKVVVSRDYAPSADNPWAETTTVIDIEALGPWLDAQRAGDHEVLTFASRKLWTSQMATGPPDEIHLMVGPEALGEGTAVFDEQARLRLIDVRRFEGSPNVVLRYEPGEGRSGD